jgi:hypothetical protein
MDLGIQTAASKGKLCLFAFMFWGLVAVSIHSCYFMTMNIA